MTTLLRAKEGTHSLTDVSSVARARVRPVPPMACHRVECVQGKEKTGVLIQGRNDEIEQRTKKMACYRDKSRMNAREDKMCAGERNGEEIT